MSDNYRDQQDRGTEGLPPAPWPGADAVGPTANGADGRSVEPRHAHSAHQVDAAGFHGSATSWAPQYPQAGSAAQSVVHVHGRESGNGLGTGGFVVGLIALVFSFVPVIGMIAWILAPLGLILAGVGLTKEPRGLAIAGVVVSGFALLICLLWVAALS